MGAQGVFGEAVDRIGGQPINSRMARKAPIRHIDLTLLLVTLLLSAFGGAMILSATSRSLQEQGGDPAQILKRQIAFMIGGAILMVLASLFDYRHLRGISPFIYGASIVGLGLVLSPLGETVKGAKRWISLGAFQMQPSEVTKVALIIAIAAYLAERKGEVRWLDVGVVILVAAVPAALIYLEPDLGTMMVLVALVGGLLLIGGARLVHFLMLAGLGLLAIALALQFNLLQEYQLERLTAFMDTSPDVQSESYNLHQSKIAIGSGGFSGRGFVDDETQTSLDFVPEQHTDFIFTAVGEQLGFVGAAGLLSLFAFMIWRALRISSMSRDMFGTLIAAGIATLWAFQLFVNVGMTMGIMPITGIPLPFMSYGGSSLMTNFIAVGLLMNIHMRRFL